MGPSFISCGELFCIAPCQPSRRAGSDSKMQHALIFNSSFRNSASRGFTPRQFHDSSLPMKLPGGHPARLRECCANMPDPRSGKNRQYSMIDAGMAAFSVFLAKSPSFPARRKLLAARRGLSNCLALFGMERIPSDSQMRNLLDPVPPERFDPVFIDIARDLDNRGALAAPRSRRSGLDRNTLIALDGTECFNSCKIGCPNCSTRTRNKGTDDGTGGNCHAVLGAAIVGPGQVAAAPLPPETVRPQDGSRKQDCERNAVKRRLHRAGPRPKDLEPARPGDGPCACQPVCEAIRAAGGSFILTANRSSRRTLHEELDRCTPETLDKRATRGIGKPKRCRHGHGWQPELRIRGGAAAMPATWVRLEIRDMAGKSAAFNIAFAADLPDGRTNVADIVACGRSRWRVENAGLNVPKNPAATSTGTSAMERGTLPPRSLYRTSRPSRCAPPATSRKGAGGRRGRSAARATGCSETCRSWQPGSCSTTGSA